MQHIDTVEIEINRPCQKLLCSPQIPGTKNTAMTYYRPRKPRVFLKEKSGHGLGANEKNSRNRWPLDKNIV